MPTYIVTDPSTGRKLKLTGDSPPTEQELEAIFRETTPKQDKPTQQTQVAPEDVGIFDDIDAAIAESPLMSGVTELASGLNRSVFGMLDFLGPDTVNAVMELSGSDYRMPTTQQLFGAQKGSFTEEGLTQDILAGTGEALGLAAGVGAGLRRMAQAAPQLGQTVSQRVVREAARGTGTISADVGLTAAGVAGQESGQAVAGDVGGIIGSVLAPMAAIKTAGGLKSFISRPDQAKQLAGLPDKVAEKVLFESMQREGMSPSDLARTMDDLGEQAILGDAGDVFRRNLRAIINKVPNLEGAATNVLRERQTGQSARILNAFDQASGMKSLDVDEQIDLLNVATRPQIKALYDQARSKSIQMSPKLRSLFESDGSIRSARKKAESAIRDLRQLDQKVSNIDIIDETKKVLDDEIGSALRKGRVNEARRKIELKNLMVSEADKAIPEYKQARDAFAGKANLENSANLGESIFRMKPRDVANLSKSMGDSEKKMFILGAKRAITDNIDKADINANAVRRIFGRRGDIEKLKSLFPDEKAFNQFAKEMRREGEFISTRNAVRGNSTTVEQKEDIERISGLFDIEPTLNPMQFARGIASKRAQATAKKAQQAYDRGLEKAGEIMLRQGNSREVMDILLKASDDNLNRMLSDIYPDAISAQVGRSALTTQLGVE